MDNYIGKKIEGRYEILELIGAGGMANVYRAFDHIEGRVVAVKILRDEYLSNEDFIRRFKNESKAIAVLSHPNIVKVYDVCFTDKIQCIVMEYIDGITLKEYIDQQHVLGWKEAVYFTEQILRALQHAHRKGIVHRDIKPQNIMLLSDGSIKVMDFGIARFARYETKTMTDIALGSVHYISPEQARGEGTDEKTDLYSVGVMLFEMLTGELPFEAENAVSVAIKQIQAEPKRPRQINPNIPEGLEEITMKAMQKDIFKRYQTAEEMLRDVERFKQNPSIRFEYKYFIDDNPTKYYNAINRARREDPALPEEYEEDEEEYERRGSPLIPILSGVATAFIICAIGFAAWVFLYANPFERIEDIAMPNLYGLRFDELENFQKSNPEYKDLRIEIGGYVDSEQAEEGVIVAQDPVAERLVKPTELVKVTVSTGVQILSIPSVNGMEREAALAELKKQGFDNTEVVYEASDTITEGYVIRTSPENGTQVEDNAQLVTVYVSQGAEAEMLPVPRVVGLKIEDAQRIIENAGFKLGEQTPVDSDLDERVIVEQWPQEGEEAEAGSSINISYSSGLGAAQTITLTIPTPTYRPDLVTMALYLNGELVRQDQINPSLMSYWQVDVSGSGNMATASVTVNGELYQEYMLNFDTGQQYLELDNSFR